LFIEPETERHIGRTPAPGLIAEATNHSWEASPGKPSTAIPDAVEMAGRTRPIVRLDMANRMVTKGYQKGVYKWVTKGTCGI
jgi:hypothetical protein